MKRMTAWLAVYNPVVLEGAGSISEINLREVDLVNMPMAEHAGARRVSGCGH